MAVGILVPLAMLLATAWIAPLRTLEAWSVDWRLSLPHRAPDLDDFLIVAVEESTFDVLETWGPASLERSTYVPVIDHLADAGARSIAIDVFFSGKSTPAADAALSEAMARAGNVIIVGGAQAKLSGGGSERKRFALPPDSITDSARAVASPLLFRPDSTVRWVHTMQREETGETAWPALSRALLLDAVEDVPEHVMINWTGSAGSLHTVSFERVHDDPQSARAARGKFVLVGITDEMKDLFDTPVGPMSGVEIHAQAAATMLSGRYIRDAPATVGLLVALPAALVVALIGRGRRHWLTWTVAAGVSSIWVIAAVIVFQRGLVLVPLAGPGLAVLATGVVISAMQSETALSSLARIWPSWVREEGEQLEVTVLVCDMAGYTARSEQVQPADLMAMMREFFAIVDEVVGRWGGVSARRPGDAAVVFFRPDEDREHHAARAIGAAQNLRERLDERWPEEDIGFGITLTTGDVSLGWVGEEPPEPQILGDPVNVAFRLQSECRERDCPIIADWETATADEQMMTQMRPLGEVEVRNRTQPVQIFTPDS